MFECFEAPSFLFKQLGNLLFEQALGSETDFFRYLMYNWKHDFVLYASRHHIIKGPAGPLEYYLSL